MKRSQRTEPKVCGLLGVGLDGDDGHSRLTRGQDVLLVGGSEETHARMQETVIRVNDKLTKTGRRITDVSPRELHDLLLDSQR